jgi:predicted phage tail protein
MITKDHVTYFFTFVAFATGVWAAFLQGGMVLALTTASGISATLAGINKMSAAAPAVPPANPTPKGP